MGSAQRRERERDEIRTRILDAARELFATEGYEAVTMRAIAARIEYTATALYFHFKDKETLFRDLCARDFLSLAQRFQRIARIADPIERIRETGRAYAAFGFENPHHYRLMFMTAGPKVDEQDSGIEKGNPEQDAYAFLRAVVVEAIGARRLREDLTDPDLVAQALWSAVHGVVSLHIAKCSDAWLEWRPEGDRVELVIQATLAGMLREGAGATVVSGASRSNTRSGSGKAAAPAHSRVARKTDAAVQSRRSSAGSGAGKRRGGR